MQPYWDAERFNVARRVLCRDGCRVEWLVVVAEHVREMLAHDYPGLSLGQDQEAQKLILGTAERSWVDFARLVTRAKHSPEVPSPDCRYSMQIMTVQRDSG